MAGNGFTYTIECYPTEVIASVRDRAGTEVWRRAFRPGGYVPARVAARAAAHDKCSQFNGYSR